MLWRDSEYPLAEHEQGTQCSSLRDDDNRQLMSAPPSTSATTAVYLRISLGQQRSPIIMPTPHLSQPRHATSLHRP